MDIMLFLIWKSYVCDSCVTRMNKVSSSFEKINIFWSKYSDEVIENRMFFWDIKGMSAWIFSLLNS